MVLPGGAEELRAGTTREQRRLHWGASWLRACYAMRGTERVHGATLGCRPTCYPLRASRCAPRLSAYALAMRCPVLTERILMLWDARY
eukprot:3933897-Rhodomonas_salina.4